jgi:hypothetical protein
MATQEKYQGWANYETWNVALWFDNEHKLYDAVLAHPDKFTAKSAEAFVKKKLPNGTSDFKKGGYAKVDWNEIAANFNEMRGHLNEVHAGDRWEVVVGNVGTVFDGTRESAARQTYKDYVIKSKSNNGRAGGEDVTLMKNGEPVAEHFGTNQNEEARRRPMARAQPRLDAFTRQYIETALWSSTDNADDSGGDPLDENYGADDIAPETMAKMVADCDTFQSENAEALEIFGDDSKAGHYFWLARNGHGAGFTDNDYKVAPELSAAMKHLQKAAQDFGNFDLYVGDDGLIYGPPEGSYGVRERRPVMRAKRAPTVWTEQNTEIHTWFERDRAHVDLRTLDGVTIIEWWDEAVNEAVEDGFLDPRDWHESAVEYANYIGAEPATTHRRTKRAREPVVRAHPYPVRRHVPRRR